MTRRLDRYVVTHVLELTGITALALTAIYTLVVFISDVNEAGKGSYGVLQVLEYSALMIPSSLYTLMPIIALLGTLLGIGQLARNSELTAMRAAGMSLLRIGGATVLAGAALALFAFALGDWIAPASENAANALRDDARGESGSMARSLWLRDGDRVLRIRRLESEDHARDLTAYRLTSDGRIASASMVDEATYAGGHWQLHGVQRTDFGEQETHVSQVDEVELEGGISPTVLKLFVLEANSLSVGGLLRLIHYMDDNHIDAGKYRMLLWRKLVEPLTVVVMMLFAVPFVSGRMRDAGAGARMLFGVLVGIVFYVGNKVAVSLGEIYDWPAPLAASFPTLLLASVAFWSLRRAR